MTTPTISDELWSHAPTKTYRGYVGAEPDWQVTVTVDDGGGVRFLVPKIATAGFSWGQKGRSPGETQLALAILDDALGNEDEATRVYQRFKHRVIANWSAGANWSITLRDVLATVQDILDVEKATAGERAHVARQPPPVANEGGGMPGAPIRRSDKDQGPGARIDLPADPAAEAARKTALAKLTDEERRALGL